jgi:signal transduction histidine kinase
MRSKLRRSAPELAWGAFAAANLVAMFALEDWQTVPFHFIWVSLTILYGFRRWRPLTTAAVLAAVGAGTGAALAHAAQASGEQLDELTEVPLMAMMFLAMVWHARRRQIAVDALARASERERQFARDASHELRTPITIARGHAELVRLRVTGTPEEADVDVLVDELDRLGAIAGRLLTLAAIEREEGLRRREIDVAGLVAHAHARWSAAAPRTWGCDADAPGYLVADSARLESALDALVANAVAATGPGDPVTLRCRADGGTVCIEVVDGGRGIEPADLRRVFERFARVVPAAGPPVEGTGLGLAIVRGIAEAHGGRATATSTPGVGSRFVIELPGFVATGERLVTPG